MENKMTKRDYFKAIIAETSNEAIKAFCEKEIALLEAKAEKAKGKTSKAKTETEARKAIVLDALAEIGIPVSVSALMKREALAEFSNQRVTALLTQLLEDKKVKREVVKRVAYYSVAEASTEEVEVEVEA